MRVKIGKYTTWFGPYQLAELLCFWVKPVKDEYGIPSKPDWVHDFGEWLASGRVEPDPKPGDPSRPMFEPDKNTKTLLHKFLLWIDSKKTRTISVRIDPWDTWSADHTLAHIILPMLKQLKTTKMGGPFVDDEDVPEYLRSTAAPPKKDEWDTDDNHFKRWDYVLDEMIFAFENKLDDSWEDKFRTGEYDLHSEVCEWDENGKPKMWKMVNGPNHTAETDWPALKLYQDRISNGFRLFGKYYESLWS